MNIFFLYYINQLIDFGYMQLEIPNHTNGSFKSNSNEAYWRYFGSSHVQILTHLHIGESWVCERIYTPNFAGLICRCFFLQNAFLFQIFWSSTFIFYRWLLKQKLTLFSDTTFSAGLPMYNTIEVNNTDILA